MEFLIVVLIFVLPIVALGVFFHYENKKEEQSEQTENGTGREEKEKFFTNFNSGKKESSEKETMWQSLSRVGGWVHTLVLFLMMLLFIVTVILLFVSLSEESEFGLAVVLGGLLALVVFYCDYIIAGYFYFAARDKGYDELVFLAAPLFIPAIGHLLVIALPDRGNGRKER